MKKFDIITFIAILAAFVGLVLLKVTGMTGHIALSVIALVIMVFCAIRQHKEWAVPALEVLYRVFYFVCLVSGIAMVAAHMEGAVSIVHKATAVIFIVLYIVNFVKKAKKA